MIAGIIGIMVASPVQRSDNNSLTNVKSRKIAKAAPNAAPEATPSVSGDTSGLPKAPCIRAPAMANPVPAMMAKTTLGTLYSHRISF